MGTSHLFPPLFSFFFLIRFLFLARVCRGWLQAAVNSKYELKIFTAVWFLVGNGKNKQKNNNNLEQHEKLSEFKVIDCSSYSIIWKLWNKYKRLTKLRKRRSRQTITPSSRGNRFSNQEKPVGFGLKECLERVAEVGWISLFLWAERGKSKPDLVYDRV